MDVLFALLYLILAHSLSLSICLTLSQYRRRCWSPLDRQTSIRPDREDILISASSFQGNRGEQGTRVRTRAIAIFVPFTVLFRVYPEIEEKK